MKAALMLLLFLPTLMLGAEPANIESPEFMNTENIEASTIENNHNLNFYNNFYFLRYYSVSIDCEGDGIIDYSASHVEQEHVDEVVDMFLDFCN